MAANMTDFWACATLNAARGVALAVPAALYVGLYTVTPNKAGVGTEVSTGGGSLYTRRSLTLTAPVSGTNTSQNSATIAWPAAGADWGDVVGVGIHDDPTAGNMLYRGPLGLTKTVSLGVIFRLVAGQLTVLHE